MDLHSQVTLLPFICERNAYVTVDGRLFLTAFLLVVGLRKTLKTFLELLIKDIA